MTSDFEDLISVMDFCEAFPIVKYGTLRGWIKQNRCNIMEKAMFRIGKKVYVRKRFFFEWLNENQIHFKEEFCHSKGLIEG